jgi:hypothetical protein
MSTEEDPARAAQLATLKDENALTPHTRHYRCTLSEFLGPQGGDGRCPLSANPDPSEAVNDVYGGGHISLAAQIGPGLAWGMSAENEWQEDGRVTVELRLADALDQGGLIYPVESIIVDQAWYVTLPAGSVAVRQLS